MTKMITCLRFDRGKAREAAEAGGKIETLLEQLRQRQLSVEQIETYQRQRAAAEILQTLNEAQAHATMQTSLTNSKVQIQIVENQGEAELAKARKAAEADLARARKMAEQMVVTAEAELLRSRKQAEQTVVLAQAEAEQRTLAGKGEASRIAQVGLSEASVLLRKIQSFSDPRLYALTQVANQLANSSQPLVPQRVFMAGANGHSSGGNGSAGSDQSAQGLFGLLLSLMVAEKSGFGVAEVEGTRSLAEYADKMAREVMTGPAPQADKAAEPKADANGAKPPS